MNIVFMGTPDFAVPVLARLLDESYHVVAVVTQPDRPVGRKKRLTPPPVKRLAEARGIPVLQPEKIRKREAQEEVLRYQPDLIVTCAYGQILPVSLLEAPKYGAINVHASLLPEYRGAAPIHRAIMDGKKETGVTIMYMVKELDAGDILSQKKVAIEEDDNVGTLHDKLAKAGADLLIETLPALVSGNITPIKQDEARATYVSTLTREDERIDWTRPGEAVYNHIRGLDPFPGAYTIFRGQPLKIWKAVKTERSADVPAGTVLAVEPDGFVVKTGDEVAIKVVECQPAGKRRMPVSAFLNGVSINVGEILGG